MSLSKLWPALVGLIIFLITIWLLPQSPPAQPVDQTPSPTPTSPTATPAPAQSWQVVADNLTIPWEIAFLPDNTLLVTQRPGELVKLSHPPVRWQIDGVVHQGEGGLLGMALHPDFNNNHWLYLYLTTRQAGKLINQVVRYQLIDEQLLDKRVIIDNIPANRFHNGGRIEFGPDGYLYVTTGDAQQPQLAQKIDSLAGKILRVTDTGEVPPDNPFGNLVYSYGHRNPQGLAWDSQAQLWSTEHGPSGTQTGNDELNLILPGRNYGWPVIKGQQAQPGMTSPVLESGSQTWAPADVEFLPPDLLVFAGLKGQALFQVRLKDQSVFGLTAKLANQFGRLRVVRLSPDNQLYLATSNQDGRGEAQTGGDKILLLPDWHAL